MDNWVDVEHRLPLPEESGAFGVVQVMRQCAGRTDKWQGIAYGLPIFLGGDMRRVLWVDPETRNPIENASWFVTHWRSLPKFPEPKADPA